MHININEMEEIFMSVMRNTFSGVLSAVPNLSTSYKTYTITGLTSETSTTNVNYMNEEASLHFLNALHKTLVDAGYGDTVKNEAEHSITVLGFKFFTLVTGTGSLTPSVYIHGYNSPISGNTNYYIINEVYNPYSKFDYNITVRGDSNHVSIYLGNYANPTAEQPLVSIAKGKNLITSSDIYMFGSCINSTTFMREKSDLYNCFLNNASTPLTQYVGYKGLNTNSKFVCVPQLAYYNTCLIYSMVQGNSSVFTSGKYYKIGSEIYYNENGYLYKVG